MKDLIVSNKQLPAIKEGILKGLEVASGAKSSATYYHKREDQVNAVKNAIANLYNISKELPLLLANQKGVTGFFIQEALLNELKNTEKGGSLNIVNPKDWYDAELGTKAISNALHNLDDDNGIPYVLRLFMNLKNNKINNARARRIALEFIWGHPNLDFICVKYRNKIKAILQHIYGIKTTSILLTICKGLVTKELFKDEQSRLLSVKHIFRFNTSMDQEKLAKIMLFIFGEAKPSMFDKNDSPVMTQYFKAKKDISKCDLVPEEVLIGLVGSKNHPQYEEKWSSKELRAETLKSIREKTTVTTANQAVRQTKKNEELGVSKEVNVKQVTDFLALYKTGYESGFTSDINKAISALATKKKFKDFMYEKVGVVVDKSASMAGHKTESKNTPRAIAEFTIEILKKSAKVHVEETNEQSSDLASAFLQTVGHGEYDAVFILSDGYENSYEGLLDEVVEAWRGITGSVMPIYHISPITGAETKAKVRSLGTQVSSMAIAKPEGLLLQLNGKLLEQDTKAWLKNQFKTILN